MSEISVTERANRAVKQLGPLLGIEPDGTTKCEDKLKEVYKFPIDKPLKQLCKPTSEKLKDFLVDPPSDFNTAKTRLEPLSKLMLDQPKLSVSEKTLAMRKELESILNEVARDDDKKVFKEYLVKWIVSDWGGIRSSKNESLMECIRQAEEDALKNEDARKNDGNFAFDRIASWSKYLAFRNPQKYAIYDARVIYSLNWLLFQSNCQPYFPFLEGQNTVMGLLDYRIHIFFKKQLEDANKPSNVPKTDNVIERPEENPVIKVLKDDINERRKAAQTANSHFLSGLNEIWPDLFIEKKKAFSAYYILLDEIAKMLFPEHADHRLTKTEMLLFSIADAEIAKSVLDFVAKQIPKAASGTN